MRPGLGLLAPALLQLVAVELARLDPEQEGVPRCDRKPQPHSLWPLGVEHLDQVSGRSRDPEAAVNAESGSTRQGIEPPAVEVTISDADQEGIPVIVAEDQPPAGRKLAVLASADGDSVFLLSAYPDTLAGCVAEAAGDADNPHGSASSSVINSMS